MRKRNIKKQIWLDVKEVELLKRKSKEAGLSEAEFIRSLIKGYRIKEKPTKEIIREFIDKIEIHSDKQVDIYFNFKPLQELNENLNSFCVAKKEYEKNKESKIKKLA